MQVSVTDTKIEQFNNEWAGVKRLKVHFYFSVLMYIKAQSTQLSRKATSVLAISCSKGKLRANSVKCQLH